MRAKRYLLGFTKVTLAFVIVSLILAGCGQVQSVTAPAHTPQKQTLVIFAAANVTAVFTKLKKEFEAAHPGVTVKISFAGTQVLQEQLQQGAVCDVFVSADRTHMKTLLGEGLVTDMHTISHDEEVVIAPKANPAGITSWTDIANKPVKLIIGVANVPIGQYTRKILLLANAHYGASFAQDAMQHVVSLETDVKEVLTKVELGQADAGVVYVTDVFAAADREQVLQFPIPHQLNRIAVNQMAIIKGGAHEKLARTWTDFVLSAQGQKVFADFGYLQKGQY